MKFGPGFAVVALATTAVAAAPAALAASRHSYMAILEWTCDADGKIATLTLDKVIDAATGSTAAVKVKPPSEAWMAAAKARQSEKTYEPNAHFFTYYPYYPGE